VRNWRQESTAAQNSLMICCALAEMPGQRPFAYLRQRALRGNIQLRRRMR
jgi:hypothetical protein